MMNKTFQVAWRVRGWLLLAVAVLAVAAVTLVPAWRVKVSLVRPAEANTQLSYWCPMHPQIKRADPNEDCPLCNMPLVRMESSHAAGEAPRFLAITARQVQQAGVVSEPIRVRRLVRELEATGRIEIDERRTATITSWIRGKSRLGRLAINVTGTRVEKGQLLAELYSPELVVAQREFLLALKTAGRTAMIDLVKPARRKLADQGMSAEQIEELARDRKLKFRVAIHSPISGTVIRRPVQPGGYVNEGDVLLEVADLDRLWVLADVHEDDQSLVSLGQPVTFDVRGLPGARFEGEVAFVDPVLDRKTRTLRVRIDVENPDGRLKPGMFARVRLRWELADSLAVPEQSVLFSGRRAVVIVREPHVQGVFQPRELRLGQRWLYDAEAPDGEASHRRYHQVLAGITEDEQLEVVTTAAFLLNAESQFQNVITRLVAPDAAADGGEYDPRVERELAKLPVDEREPARRQKLCPVTNKFLGTMGVPIKMSVGDRSLFICCRNCESNIRDNPDRYLEQRGPGR